MDLSPFVYTLLAVTVPVLALLVAAAWLAGRGVGRVRFATRDGRILAELVIGPAPRPAPDAENPGPGAFRP
jgi:uncharacterized membrane protein (DUF441 family)